MERTNARELAGFPEPVELVTIDVSFIGLEKVLPAALRSAPAAEVVALFKPQFQVGRDDVGKGGIVRDDAPVARSLGEFREWCAANGYRVIAQAPSALPGAEGNQEVFFHIRPAAS
jgi:23S rRNA (cytidine1920-2'-O)/16S rRNA (cytidine1409-2'-O)-methyltransferase